MITSYAQNFEDVMLWRALKHVERGFYIDVGANDPVVDSVTQFFYQHGWCGINIEPLASHWRALQHARVRDTNLQCAAGAFEGEVRLWECDVRGWATADEEVIAHHLANGHSGHYATITQTTLNRVWLQHAPPEVHFLKVDVEGFEHSVLEGLDLQRYRPWIVLVEATRPNTTQEVHAQWEHLLIDADYRFVYADGLNRFYVAGERQELADAFRYPPNVLDQPHMDSELWAQTLSARADHALQELTLAELRATQAELRATQSEEATAHALALAAAADSRASQAGTRATAALAHAAHVDARIESLLKSTSWRVTLPLRIVSNGLSGLKPIPSRNKLTNWAASTLRYAASRPLLRKIGTQVLTRFPSAKSSLKTLVRSAPVEHVNQELIPSNLAHLSPRVRALYATLRREWADLASPPSNPLKQVPARRHRLAYVSPLPPARSGIADYSAELLPALARFYDIDVILEQPTLSDRWIETHCGVRDSKWLLQNPAHYDRVLYHFGNSSYHQHMFHLLTQVPGLVVLHDFYLGDVLNYLEAYAVEAFAFQRGLYKSHGYGALATRVVPCQFAKVAEHYPANLEVLQLAQGVIVHSEHSKQLAATWYGKNFAKNWSIIALVRKPNANIDRSAARRALGLHPGEFMVCSFGLMGPTKLNHRLLQAWLNSAMARDENCRLVFVGEEQAAEYGTQIKQAIEATGMRHRVRISGWNDPARYAHYLMAADLAVQLRGSSRGETSAAVLDCMNYGLPTIVNAHGALAELPREAVWMLAEDFDNAALTAAIDTLWQDDQRRHAMGRLGQECILNRHAPDVCADQYRQAIERDHAAASLQAQALTLALTSFKGIESTEAQFIHMAQTFARQMAPINPSRQLLVDVSATCRNDLKTGIQRVVRALVWSLIQAPPDGYRVEPVYLKCDTGVWHYCYAREWTSRALEVASAWMPDDPVDCGDGDVLLIADFTSGLAVEAGQAGAFAALKAVGVGIHFFVYDLLPIQMPQCFPPGQFGFAQWLRSLTGAADSAICISHAVARDLQNWMNSAGPPRDQALRIDWFHLGADLANSIPSAGLAPDSDSILDAIRTAPSFLMVGTIEPRKGYLQTLQAFNLLWQSGMNIKLVVVGREGWTGLTNDQRQTIPQIVSLMQTHPELSKRLLWLDDVSDEYLAQLYANSVGLIAASEGEGFGLPLIEAAQHALPIIARDIPVFREVAGDHAFYFDGLDAQDLARAIQAWLGLKAENKQPMSQSIPWLTWEQSTQRVLEALQLAPKHEFSAPCGSIPSTH